MKAAHVQDTDHDLGQFSSLKQFQRGCAHAPLSHRVYHEGLVNLPCALLAIVRQDDGATKGWRAEVFCTVKSQIAASAGPYSIRVISEPIVDAAARLPYITFAP